MILLGRALRAYYQIDLRIDRVFPLSSRWRRLLLLRQVRGDAPLGSCLRRRSTLFFVVFFFTRASTFPAVSTLLIPVILCHFVLRNELFICLCVPD